MLKCMFLLLLDYAGHIVRQAAAGVGQELSFFDDGHLGLRTKPDDFGGDLGSGGHAADNDNTQW